MTAWDHAGLPSRGAIRLGISSAASDAWYRRSCHVRPTCGARREWPGVLLALAGLVVAVVAGWDVVSRRGAVRVVALVVSAAAVALVVWGLAISDFRPVRVVLILVLAAVSVGCARVALRRTRRARRAATLAIPAARRASHPVLIMNPRSGGGKAERFYLAEECRTRGIEPIVAARHRIPHVVVPAGTRNHFALDLGLDRDDVVGALEAFGEGVERRVDLAEVNGRVFVNNASLGLYAKIVQTPEYRDAKSSSRTTPTSCTTSAAGGPASGSTGHPGPGRRPDQRTRRRPAVRRARSGRPGTAVRGLAGMGIQPLPG